jgi:hypothetical protein
VFLWWVPRTADEGSELFVRADDGTPAALRRRLVVRMRAETLVDPARCRALLRRELLFAADMIDADFGYEPSLHPSPSPAEDRRVAARYGAAWAATVVGRLGKLLPADAHAEAAERFLSAFPMLGAAAREVFDRLLSRRPTHADLARLAADPVAAAGLEPTATTGFPLLALPYARLLARRPRRRAFRPHRRRLPRLVPRPTRLPPVRRPLPRPAPPRNRSVPT